MEETKQSLLYCLNAFPCQEEIVCTAFQADIMSGREGSGLPTAAVVDTRSRYHCLLSVSLERMTDSRGCGIS